MAKILAIDLGKFKSVACLFNSADGEYSYRTLRTTPVAMRELLTAEAPDRVVIEIGSQAGWLADLSESLGIELQVANPYRAIVKSCGSEISGGGFLGFESVDELGSLNHVG